MLSSKQKQKIKKLFQDEPIDAVYLFGSQANGQAGKLSDYDFGIIFQEGLNSSERFQRKLMYIAALEAIVQQGDIDVVDFSSVPLRYQYNIVAPQTDLLISNPQRVKPLEAQTTKCFLDQRYYHHRTAKRQMELLAQEGFQDKP